MGKTNDEKRYCIYMHKFPNLKVYIGQTCLKPEYRWCNDGSGYLKKNKDGTFAQPLMAHAIKKYGWNNVEHVILFNNLTLDEANRIEQICIALFRSADSRFGYNITHGGGGTTGFHLSEEAKEKIRQANIGHIVTEETKEKIRKTNTGKFVGEKNPRYGKPVSDETKERISISIKQNPTSYKFVFCEELNLTFPTIKAACDFTGACHSSISRCCTGQLKKAKNLHWRYATKEEIEQYKIVNGIEVV